MGEPVNEKGGPGGGSDSALRRKDFLKRTVAGIVVGAAALTHFEDHAIASGAAETPAAGGRRWGMIIDLKKCVGCRACMMACKAENHTPPGTGYNVVTETETGEYPYVKREFVTKPCMQCAKTSCVGACPVKATYRRDDGITVVDYDKCIGCGYCVVVCPYNSRKLDHGRNYTAAPTPYDAQPSPEYGENRERARGRSPIGNARKCTFCLHRILKGLAPACASSCIGHAIHFGDLSNPDAVCMVHGENLRELLTLRSYKRLKEELGNEPSVYYLV